MNVALQTNYDVSDTIPINMSLSLGEVLAGAETANTSLMVTKKNLDIANLTLKKEKQTVSPFYLLTRLIIIQRQIIKPW